mgnify:CR=1 FL=1
MKLELEVVGPNRGKSFAFRNYSFVDGRITLEGSLPQVMGASTFLERTQQAFPVGSAALAEMIELIHGKPVEVAALRALEHPPASPTTPEATSQTPAPAPVTPPLPAAPAAATPSEGVKNGDVQVPEGTSPGKSAEVPGGATPVSQPPDAAPAAGRPGADGASAGPTGVLPSGSGQPRPTGNQVKAAKAEIKKS